MSKTANYNASSITQMEFLEAIRRLPGMYIGDTEEHGLHHIALEVIDNSVDEVLAKFASKITITIEKDGTFVVGDDGRGIPIEWKKDAKESSLTLVLTKPHAGGKFKRAGSDNDDAAYSASGGLHGIGLKCTNAMSSMVRASVRKYGLSFVQTFTEGGSKYTPVEIFDANKEKVGEINDRTELIIGKDNFCDEIKVDGKKISVACDKEQKSGTEIRFRPNREWFSPNLEWEDPDKNVPWSEKRLETRLSQTAFLNPGVKIEFLDKRVPKERQEKKVFYSKEGIKDYVEYLNDGLKPLHKPIMFEETAELEINKSKHTIKTQIALQYCVGDDLSIEPTIVAFTNNIPNPDLGEHVTAFRTGFSKAINGVAVSKKWVKSADEFKNDDVFAGMTAVVSITMSNTPQFSSQTKVKLTSTEVRSPVLSATNNFLSEYFSKPSNAEIGKLIVQQAKTAKESRDAATKVRQTMIKKSGLDAGLNFIGKTADIRRQNGESIVPKEYTALYLCEGDSAGGAAKLGRDSRFHAILPLRGKPENVAKKTKLSEILDNEEIKSLVTAIGAGIGADFDIEQMRYGRIVLMADADVDGSHIQALLITFFWKFMRPIIEQGRLYAARPPLFLVQPKRGKDFKYAYSDVERDKLIKEFGGVDNVEITRYKGLGEMNASQLSDTVLVVPPGYGKNDKKSKKDEVHLLTVADFAYRDLLLTVDDVHETNETIDLWMGNRAQDRNEWLMNHSWEISE